MTTNAALRDTLQELHRQTAQSPLFNPVFQLSLDLSREIENGALSLGDVGGLVAELECESLQVRARHLARMLAPVGIADNLAAFDRLATSDKCDFDAFNCRWQSPLMQMPSMARWSRTRTTASLCRKTPCRRIACVGSISSVYLNCAAATSRKRPAVSTCIGAPCSASSPSARRNNQGS